MEVTQGQVKVDPMRMEAYHMTYEADATYYSFLVANYSGMLVFSDVNGGWCGTVAENVVRRAIVGDEPEDSMEYAIDRLFRSVGFNWSWMDARNIITGYIANRGKIDSNEFLNTL